MLKKFFKLIIFVLSFSLLYSNEAKLKDKGGLFSEDKKRPVIKIMGHFDVYPIFIATFVPRRETLTATHSRT